MMKIYFCKLDIIIDFSSDELYTLHKER